MNVDKDLFFYDLAVVAIMKNEAPYVKEWLDYHILAGVDHFYIYDNESPDNLKEILQPYIDAGIVTYKFYPGIGRQIEAYTDAFKSYRFFCRYMAFIDADEFIFPQNNKSIVEVVDEIFKDKPDMCALNISWVMYGSNNLETADYSKGVLERFTRRAVQLSKSVKTIANPRRINYLTTPHYMEYFSGNFDIGQNDLDERTKISKEIIINHYKLKSREEYFNKIANKSYDASYGTQDYYNADKFTHEEDNETFDDSILKYRDARLKVSGNNPQIDYQKLTGALMKNLSPLLNNNLPVEFFEDKMETFLTCRALAAYLKENVIGKENGEKIEKLTLTAIHNTLLSKVSAADVEMLLSEMSNLLPLNYPMVQNIRVALIELIPQVKEMIKAYILKERNFLFWLKNQNLDNMLEMLKTFDEYEHK